MKKTYRNESPIHAFLFVIAFSLMTHSFLSYCGLSMIVQSVLAVPKRYNCCGFRSFCQCTRLFAVDIECDRHKGCIIHCR